MAISGLNTYRDVLYQWQGQQLKSTGAASSSKNPASTLFGNNVSMTQQISSMIELTRYAMNQMGVSGDGRVTFSQITKYREQLQSEFNSAVKQALSTSGLKDPTSLTFSVDRDGTIAVAGGSAEDRKKAQQFFDDNPAWGKEIRASLTDAGVEASQPVEFRLSSSGKLSILDPDTDAMQQGLDAVEVFADAFQEAMAELGVSGPVALLFDDQGNLKVSEHPQADDLNTWLAGNQQMAQELAKLAAKNNIAKSSLSLNVPARGKPVVTVHNQALKDAQAGLDRSGNLGSRLYSALSSLSVDTNVSFSLQLNDDGTLNVISDHPDADKVRRLFAENPELVKKYRQIEALTGIDDARKAMQISPNAMRKRIQIESMASWWAESGTADSYFGQYSSGNLSLLSGLNMKI